MAERTIVGERGTYAIGKTLGQGGYSKVKLGRNLETGNYVALKLLKPEKMDESSRKSVEKEVRAMHDITHENVVKLIDLKWEAVYVKKNGKQVVTNLIVIEYAAGGELFDFLMVTGAFSERIARTYFAQLVNGLDACHSMGVAHRDLKPENILLDARFVLKIADFGLCAPPEKQIRGGLMQTECGTVGYMAPEMRTRAYNAFLSDIWAAGVVLFITLAGFPPFAKADNSDWWFNKLNNNRHDLFWKAHCRTVFFSANAKDLLNKMLSPNPASRISLDGIKSHPFFNEGDVFSAEALTAEFTERKLKVDQHKVQEKLQKTARQGEGLDGAIVRDLGEAVDPEAEDLPPVAPNMQEFVVHLSANAFDGAVDDDGDDENEEDAPPAPEYQADEAPGHTQIESELSPSDLYYQVKTALSANAKTLDEKKATYKIKAQILQQRGMVNVVAQVYSKGDRSVVEFRRMKGDLHQFHALYHTWHQGIAPAAVAAQ